MFSRRSMLLAVVAASTLGSATLRTGSASAGDRAGRDPLPFDVIAFAEAQKLACQNPEGLSMLYHMEHSADKPPPTFRVTRDNERHDRIDRAVRPCFPMTFPKSLGATRSSSTVTCSPCTSLTVTSSGESTRAFAISSMSCFISRVA